MGRNKGTKHSQKKKSEEHVMEEEADPPPRKNVRKTAELSKKKKKESKSKSSMNYFTPVLVALVAFVSYYGYLGYLETRIYTPIGKPKVTTKEGIEVPERFWGTYRPGIYFGMKHRSPKSLVTGLMWLLPSKLLRGQIDVRHLCQQNDNLKKYGWIEHDGTNFGVQEIYDGDFKLVTSFVKNQGGSHGGEWTNRIEVEYKRSTATSSHKTREDMVADELILLYYVALEPGVQGSVKAVVDDVAVSMLQGNTSALGRFDMKFHNDGNSIASSFLETQVDSLQDISSVVPMNMVSKKVDKSLAYLLRKDKNLVQKPNLFIHQVHIRKSFTMEVIFESGSIKKRKAELSGNEYTSALTKHRLSFYEKFKTTFKLDAKGFNETAINFAQAAMSNLMGGVGYFHGNSKVQSVHNRFPVSYWTASLYSAVPSRSFFPRGFLWDEGFHLLLMNKWDPEISIDIISHWLDLMNTEGWIPREQILGEEAIVRVPEEFIVQRNDVANPPTLIMALYDLLERHREWLFMNHRDKLMLMWPRLSAWYKWLNQTQAGTVPTSYYWRGRNSTTRRELNPKTLASGLDDYPRASHPNDDERHLDLRCWMALSSKLMLELSRLLDHDGSKFEATYQMLTDENLLNELHWSQEMKAYADYGSHTDHVELKYPIVRNPNPNPYMPVPEKVRVEDAPPKMGFVNSFGYVSLFPMLLQLLNPDSSQLQSIVKKIDDPKLLWTPFGLRSLAKTAPLYKRRNTEHDPPYWRGPIWININFMTLKSLKYYAATHCPVSGLAKEKYAQLRKNIINNMMKQYIESGYIWEQYSDEDGAGKGCRPFTGWSSLVVLIMAEDY